MEMAESAALIRSESARRYVDGRMGRWGVVMLYPDRLASVNVRAELWGCFFGPVAMVAAGWPVTEDAGAFHAIIGVLLGSTIGRFIDRRRAARKMAAGGAGATTIPLDAIGSLRTDGTTRSSGQFAAEALLVPTAGPRSWRVSATTSPRLMVATRSIASPLSTIANVTSWWRGTTAVIASASASVSASFTCASRSVTTSSAFVGADAVAAWGSTPAPAVTLAASTIERTGS